MRVGMLPFSPYILTWMSGEVYQSMNLRAASLFSLYLGMPTPSGRAKVAVLMVPFPGTKVAAALPTTWDSSGLLISPMK